MSPLQIKDQVITPLDKVRDLGVIIDSKLTMESHTANVAYSPWLLLPISPTTKYPAFVVSYTDARRTLAVAFVVNRVDYCNAVRTALSTAVKRRLQMVLNAAARMVVGIGKLPRCFVTLCTGCQSLRGYSSRLLL